MTLAFWFLIIWAVLWAAFDWLKEAIKRQIDRTFALGWNN